MNVASQLAKDANYRVPKKKPMTRKTKNKARLGRDSNPQLSG